MSSKLPRPCAYPGCPALVIEGSQCEKHRKQIAKQYDQERGTAAQRGYDARWQKARAWYLRRNPLCVECQKEGRLMPATVVDHIKPHKGNYYLFWDASNWQSLCKACHDRKTAKEDGRFRTGG